MKNVTIPELIEILEAKNGSKIVGMFTRTAPKMLVKHRKTKEPNKYLDGELIRLAHRTVILGANYEGLVNKQRAVEGVEETFVAEELWHGKGAKHRVYTVQHKETGEIYFAYKPQVAEPEHAPKVHADEWQFNGVKLTDAEVKDLKENLLTASGDAKKQGLEKQVFWQTLDLDNLMALQYGGEQYIIDHSIPANIEYIG